MSDSAKYAGLPDIDTAPDVYETADIKQQTTAADGVDSDFEQQSRANSPSARRGQLGQQPREREGSPTDEAIDSRRNDTTAARSKFGNARWDRRERSNRNASSALPSTSVYQIGDDAAAETALDKLRRLRLEVDELELQVREEANATSSPSTSPSITAKPTRVKGEVSAAVLLKQIDFLRGDLNQPAIAALDSQLKHEKTNSTELGPSAAESSAKTSGGLLAKLGLGAAEAKDAVPVASSTSAGAPKPSAPRAQFDQGQLEQRLAQVEKLVGASEAEVDDAHAVPQPIVPTIARLEHLLTLLTQPRHLDSISRRVKVLVSDLERLHDARRKLGDSRPLAVALGASAGGMTVAAPGGGPPVALKSSQSSAELPPDALQRLEALFTLLPRIDPLLPLTPRLVTRLQSLSSLHSSAAEFATTLNGLQAELGRLSEGEAGLKDVLAGVQSSVEENAKTMGANLSSLESRVMDVSARMAALGV